MTDAELDAAILAELGPRSWKVAMVIARTAERVAGDGDPYVEALWTRIGGRISTLVADGRITAWGDVTNWHYSEILEGSKGEAR